MLTFIIGTTKSGKTTLSHLIQKILQNSEIYEAGGWALQEYGSIPCAVLPDDPYYKQYVTGYSINKLLHDPQYSYKKFKHWYENSNTPHHIINGVRNPDDFILMSSNATKYLVVIIKDTKVYGGALETFENGLKVIEEYLLWKQTINPNIKVVYTTHDDVMSGNKSVTVDIVSSIVELS